MLCWLGQPDRLHAIAGDDGAGVICPGPPVAVHGFVTTPTPTLPVLNSNGTVLTFRLASAVSSAISLRVKYSGTAQNGVDVESLPTTINFPAGTTAVTLPVTPKLNYPFTRKTLTATITNISVNSRCVYFGSGNSATIALTGFDAPRLAMTRLNSANVLLSWESPVAGYVVQTTGNHQSGTWLTLTNVPVLDQGTYRLTVGPVNGPAFFRLMKP